MAKTQREKNPVAVRRGKRNKRRGKAGESESAKEWNAIGVPAQVGRLQAKGGEFLPDVCLGDGLFCEVKRRKSMAIYGLLDEPQKDKRAGDVGFIHFRADHKRWGVALYFDDLIQFCKLVLEKADTRLKAVEVKGEE